MKEGGKWIPPAMKYQRTSYRCLEKSLFSFWYFGVVFNFKSEMYYIYFLTHIYIQVKTERHIARRMAISHYSESKLTSEVLGISFSSS